MKTRLLSLLLLMFALVANAKILSPDEALQRIHRDAPAAVRAITERQQPRLVHTVNSTASGRPGCYIFDTDNSFVVLSADDNAAAILGYGDASTFDPANIPPNMQAWLDEYANEISAAAHRNHATSQLRPQRDPIEPLMITKWSQEEPYNLRCPKQNNRRTVTGCVATAFAQIAYYHRWPEKHGYGKKNYRWTNRNLSFNYENTTFMWDQMLPEYTEDLSNTINPANNAVATLMYAVGIASEMNYSTEGSGALQGFALMGMAEHMGYSPNAYIVDRNSCGIIEWEDLIYGEIADKRPVAYTGANASVDGNYAAHEFVVDGYAEGGFFHVNWGWGGMSDGFYLLSALDPDMQGTGGSSGGYSYASSAAIGFSPATEGETLQGYNLYYSEVYPSDNTTEIGQKGKFSITRLANQSSAPLPPTIIALHIRDNEYSEIAQIAQFQDIPPSYYYPLVDLEFDFPEDLPERPLLCSPIFSTDGGESWFEAQSNIYSYNRFTIQRSGDEVKFSTPSLVFPEIGDVTPKISAYAGTMFSLSANASNSSAVDQLFQPVYCAVLPAGTDEYIPIGNYLLVELMPGESCEINYKGTLPDVTGSARLAFFGLDPFNTPIMLSDPINIEIGENVGTPALEIMPGYVIRATVPEGSSIGTATFEGEIKCTKGIAQMWTYLEATDNATGSWDYDAVLADYIEGQTTLVVVSSPISKTNPGNTIVVRLIVYDGTDFVVILPAEEVTVTEISGVENVACDIIPAGYYNLQGIYVGTDPSLLPPGIYIHSGKKIRLSH